MQKRIAILYGTTEGHTRRIAEQLATRLRAAGDDVAMIHLADVPIDWTPENSDAFLVATSVHQAKVQPYVQAFLEKHAATLNAQKSALALVSLNAALGDEADIPPETYADTLLEATEWKPQLIEHVAGALKYSEYNWAMRIVMKRIAGSQGMSTDTSQDVVFTDWEALDAFADRFHALVRES